MVLLCLMTMGASAQITAVHGTVSDEFGEITGPLFARLMVQDVSLRLLLQISMVTSR